MRILWHPKKTNLIIFQSPFQEKLFIKYNKDTFADGAFYIVPKVIKCSLLKFILNN